MRYLILSDIHANWEALEAVLAAARGAFDEIVCLGDIVGYGPDPNPVVDWVRSNVSCIVRGNHDKASCGLDDPSWFNPVAETAARWTFEQLTPDNLQFVRGLERGPRYFGDGKRYLISHGSPLDEDGYIATVAEANGVFPYLDSPVCFFGHTHLQGGYSWSRMVTRPLLMPRQMERPFAMDIREDSAYLVNPGSVGQPRDANPRAGFVLLDSVLERVVFHRVDYDITVVHQKIAHAGLPPLLGDRLFVGR